MNKKILKTMLLIVFFVIIFTIKVNANVNVTNPSINSEGEVSINITSSEKVYSYKVELIDDGGLTFKSSESTSGQANGKKINGATTSGTTTLGTYKLKAPSVNTTTKYTVKFKVTISTDGEKFSDPIFSVSTVTVNVKEAAEAKQKQTTNTSKKTTTTKKVETKKTETKKVEPKKEEPTETKEEIKQEEEKFLLEILKIEGEKITPEFNSETFEYELSVIDKEKLNIEAKANTDKAIVEVLGGENLEFGENEITINLKGQDDKQITTYTIKVLNQKSDLAVANEKIEKLEKENTKLKMFTVAFAVATFVFIIISLIVISKKENKTEV